jgi:hypothetical protein
MTRYILSLIRNKYILIYRDEANQMSRGTKKTSIGDAKLFEGEFGACIYISGMLLVKNCIKINSFSASKCA